MKHIAMLVTLIYCIIDMQAQNNTLVKQITMDEVRMKVREEIRMPQIDGYNLLICDFHLHTLFSDGIVWSSMRVIEAWEEGLDAITITDYIEKNPMRLGIEKGDYNRSFDIANKEVSRRNIILIKGGDTL